ncbi:MAG: hypothetical protein LBJ36_11535 [Synergistaceae bacterium]|jgi:uncharacterized membrane protein YgcG|nr:hypothetical protein [Synergistaceae bacterium]
MDKISTYRNPKRYRLHFFFFFFFFFFSLFCARFLACAWAGPARANPIIAAYQQIYKMNFEVCRLEELPLGWFATFDGYPVAQVSPNHWVYGRAENPGSIIPTSIAVGAVVPMDVPELARIALSSWGSGAYETKAFQSIASSGLDNIGVLNDPLAYTPVAWKTGRAELQVWLGDRWYRLVPAGGQSVSQALQMRHPYIVQTLRQKSVLWTMSDTEELADLARSWGYIWRGSIPFASLTQRRDDAGNSGSGFASESAWGGTAGPSSTSSGEWDVGGGNSSGSSGNGGGGWDTGGSSAGGGSGWDSGGSSSGGSDSSGSGGSSGGGGWDK